MNRVQVKLPQDIKKKMVHINGTEFLLELGASFPENSVLVKNFPQFFDVRVKVAPVKEEVKVEVKEEVKEELLVETPSEVEVEITVPEEVTKVEEPKKPAAKKPVKRAPKKTAVKKTEDK